MTTRGQINSNFYQIVNVDANGAPTSVKSEYIPPITNVAHANVADVANSVAGANVTGTVALAANAAHATISDSANSVAVANVTGIGNIAIINLDGNSSHVLYGNGVWSAPGGGSNGSPGGSNTQVQYNDAGLFNGSANFTFDNTSNTLTASNIAGTIVTGTQPEITSLGTLTGLTISGDVTGELVPSSNSTYSLGNTTSRWKDLFLGGNASIAGDTFITGNINVTGNTNYTNVNNLYITDPLIELGGGANGTPLTVNDGLDRGEILHYYTTEPVDAFIGWVNGSSQFAMASNVTNDNNVVTINQLGNLQIDTLLGNVSGANVIGDVANANHANISDSANSVAVANVSGIGNIATINLDGNASNILYGNGVFSAAPDAANANYANYAGNVVNSAQPNITSLGNLTSLSFNNTVTPITANVGQMFWDTGEHTVTLGMENGVQQQIGLESYIYVKASSAITDGQVVMFTGANGDNVLAAPANASSAGFKPEHILGIATQNIATNGFGYITTTGKVHGLNTNSYTVGDVLWYDSTSTTGALTNVQPTDPACQVQVGAVTKKSAGDGHIQVLVNPYTSLTQLTDVKITSPLNGQTLSYDSANSIWVNANATGGGTPGGSNTQLQFNNAGAFGGISTVTYNGTNISLGAINTVKISGGSSNNVIRTDGTGNLSFQAIATSMTVGTRTVAVSIPTSNYQMNVLTRTGNVIVNVT